MNECNLIVSDIKNFCNFAWPWECAFDELRVTYRGNFVIQIDGWGRLNEVETFRQKYLSILQKIILIFIKTIWAPFGLYLLFWIYERDIFVSYL